MRGDRREILKLHRGSHSIAVPAAVTLALFVVAMSSGDTLGQSQDLDTLLRQYNEVLPFAGGARVSAGGVSMPLQLENHTNLPPEDVYTQAVASVLLVVAQKTASDSEAEQGSAVAISPSVAITNCHVVMYGDLKEDDPAFRFTKAMQAIVIRDAGGRIGSADLILEHPDIDICLIQSRDLPLTPIAGIVPYRVVQIGEKVYSLGNPRGLTFSFGEGIVSQKRDAADLGHGKCADVIQHSAPQSPGSSGGALLNSAGLLIGITESQALDGQNLNFAIPAALLWEKYPDGKGSNVQISSPLYGAAVTGCP